LWGITDYCDYVWTVVLIMTACEFPLARSTPTATLRAAIPDWLEDAKNGSTSPFHRLLNGLWANLQTLDHRVKDMDREIIGISAADSVANRLQQLRGVGPIGAAAILASVDDASKSTIVGRWQLPSD
jgi:transposase